MKAAAINSEQDFSEGTQKLSFDNQEPPQLLESFLTNKNEEPLWTLSDDESGYSSRRQHIVVTPR